MSTTTFTPATSRQTAFIATLAAERGVTAPDVSTLSVREASRVIDGLLKLPRPRPVPVARPAVTAAPAPKVTSTVPEGHYAIDGTGHQPIDFFRVDRPTKGKWAGFVFVKRVIGGHPDMRVPRSQVGDVLARIEAAGAVESARRYGQEIGACCICNRHLTDAVSRSLGIGPDCRGGSTERGARWLAATGQTGDTLFGMAS